MIEEQVCRLGRTDMTLLPLGVGTWQWGDTRYWNYGQGYSLGDVEAAFETSLQAGITLFDTAEIYGSGRSEQILGELVRKSSAKVVVATKFAPLPTRFTARSVLQALDRSLQRLGLPAVDLYQIHWPYSLISQTALLDALVEAGREGKVRAIGVSNYNPRQMERAYTYLAKHGVALASNQVSYSLLNRGPEASGLAQLCRDLDVALIAYSPLGQGILTGKYTSGKRLSFARRIGRFYRDLRSAQPLLRIMHTIAAEHHKTMAQVALNWLLCKPGTVIPIPGAKTAKQASDNAGALGWRLSEEEVERLDHASRRWLK